MSRSLAGRLGLVLAACLLVLGFDLWSRTPLPATPRAVWPLTAQDRSAAPATLTLQARGRIPMPENTPAAHSSTLLAMPADHPASVMAFWFAGAKESAPDVQIAVSYFDRAKQQWSPARFVVSRQFEGSQLGFGVRRIGNPVAWRDASGRIHLFVVVTGLGGWAAGRILHLQQVDDGRDFARLEFKPVRVLPLSWLWKTSHLVRAMPLPLADGGMVLPVYFELGIKYPLALRFGPNAEFLGMTRISQQRDTLQPTLLARSPLDWLALMRDNSAERKIGVAQTLDGGQHWRDLPDLPLANPDASIAALALQPVRMVLAYNPLPDSRAVLDLSTSQDGLHWTPVQTLEHGQGADEYSYPSMTWADNSLWISYTDQRRAIAWQRFAFTSSH